VLLAFGRDRVLALRRATRAIPIVAATWEIRSASGFARSLAQPGSNVTGITLKFDETARIMLELLRRLKPRIARVAGATMVQSLGHELFEGLADTARQLGISWERSG
jgi:putative ABC transport system substrate-binding protein